MRKHERMIAAAELYIDKDLDIITCLANLTSLIYHEMHNINWTGFYLYNGEKLYLGPFQGLPATVLIDMNSGVCGTAATKRESIIVKDVDQFEGHIACDSNSRSEIVVPIIKDGNLFGVLDIDSFELDNFDKDDKKALESVVNLLVDIL